MSGNLVPFTSLLEREQGSRSKHLEGSLREAIFRKPRNELVLSPPLGAMIKWTECRELGDPNIVLPGFPGRKTKLSLGEVAVFLPCAMNVNLTFFFRKQRGF